MRVLLLTLLFLPQYWGHLDMALSEADISLFEDPNCTKSVIWSNVRNSIDADPRRVSSWILLSIKNQTIEGLETRCYLGTLTALWYDSMIPYMESDIVGALYARTYLEEGLSSIHPAIVRDSSWSVKRAEDRAYRADLLYDAGKVRRVVAANVSAAAMDGRLSLLVEFFTKQEARRTERNDVPDWERSTQDSYVLAKPRIYVYPDNIFPELTMGPSYCRNRQWGHDVGFHDFFRASATFEINPAEADFFFVPAYGMCLLFSDILNRTELNELFKQRIETLPYFHRREGRDHIFSMHLPDVFLDWRQHIPKSILLTPETEVGFESPLDEHHISPRDYPPFDAAKDISIPPFLDISHLQTMTTFSKPVADRRLLVAFAGKTWPDIKEAYNIRSILKEAFSTCSNCAIFAEESLLQLLPSKKMWTIMGEALFCLIPRGRAAWSVRFFESLFTGCVPVVLSDYYQIPFEQLFDVREFVIKWPTSHIHELHSYLRAVPMHHIEAMVAAAKRVRCWYLYPSNPFAVTRTIETIDRTLCPNLSSSRNAFQAVVEILSRRTSETKTTGRHAFYSLRLAEFTILMNICVLFSKTPAQHCCAALLCNATHPEKEPSPPLNYLRLWIKISKYKKQI